MIYGKHTIIKSPRPPINRAQIRLTTVHTSFRFTPSQSLAWPEWTLALQVSRSLRSLGLRDLNLLNMSEKDQLHLPLLEYSTCEWTTSTIHWLFL